MTTIFSTIALIALSYYFIIIINYYHMSIILLY